MSPKRNPAADQDYRQSGTAHYQSRLLVLSSRQLVSGERDGRHSPPTPCPEADGGFLSAPAHDIVQDPRPFANVHELHPEPAIVGDDIIDHVAPRPAANEHAILPVAHDLTPVHDAAPKLAQQVAVDRDAVRVTVVHTAPHDAELRPLPAAPRVAAHVAPLEGEAAAGGGKHSVIVGH
eukprot:CAMPEP_0181353262 /NCGR_PEP_ID=MMETSP1106-20121128/2744_1 /TAXON_ID=81844 /ORGANISM="Mantoniella antarctica, Strain SL-175" /LENGTH=177 /DNA_ID=CAMNT_0023465867 /DNA_START=347 /DNA_END=881 /DNA_ORIENTATION=+